MKSKLAFAPFFSLLILFNACKSQNQVIEPELEIVGHWKYQYELLSDGTKKYDNPYALLEFEYSDAFILKENNTGNSVWYDTINGNFEWISSDSILTIIVTRQDSSIDQFQYSISNLDEVSMEFQSPNGNKYFMVKQ